MIRILQNLKRTNNRHAAPLRLRWLILLGALLTMTIWLSVKSVQDYQALQSTKAQTQELSTTLTQLRSENTHLQIQIYRLGSENIDLDFLDERVRLVLGLAAQNETIIFDSGL